MKPDSAHKRGWEIAEVVFGVPFLLGVAMQFVIPFSFQQRLIRLAIIPVGIALTITGVVFIILARREFARHAQPTDPGRPTSVIITTGPFSISRNPLYLGSVIVILGFSLTLSMLWGLATLPLSIILCHYILILPEERYLAAKFGGEYEAYASSVHRWLGRK